MEKRIFNSEQVLLGMGYNSFGFFKFVCDKMTQVENLTRIVNESGDILTFVQGVNSGLMHDFLGILLLIGITSICFMSFMTLSNNTKIALSSSSFIAFFLALLLRMMGLIPDKAFFITLIIAAGAWAITWFD